MTAVLRFAPSPNGALHLGHALSALVGFDMARELDGRFLVRIEDIDTVRCRPEFMAAALEDLAWLGLAWEQPVLRQSEHFAHYAAAALRLSEMGLTYPCFATRTQIAAAATGACDPDGAPIYPGLFKGYCKADAARRIAAGEPYAMRLDVARAMDAAAALAGSDCAGSNRERRQMTFWEIDRHGRRHAKVARPERWGDAVIMRRDVPASYHLAVVVDDARQGITHVTRGIDLYAATDLHRLLQVLLGLPEPLYHHHRLMTDEAGRKLAKSAKDTSLRSLRLKGWSPEDVRKAVCPETA